MWVGEDSLVTSWIIDQLGLGGMMPSPRKLRVASVNMADGIQR